MRTIVWREFYNEQAIAQLTAMGTLPRYTFDLDGTDAEHMDGEEVAETIAKASNDEDPSSFRDGGMIVILEPAEFAGTYNVETEYRPSFYASREDD